MILYIFLFNLILFAFLLKLYMLIFKDKYIFPFRVAEIFNFISNIIINIIISINFFGYEYLFNIIALNCCLFLIFYNMLSMINTSSRTKILLDIFNHKKINLKGYKKIYNEKIILDNRIFRLNTNNEILIKKNKISINNDGFKFLKIVIFIFSLIKRI